MMTTRMTDLRIDWTKCPVDFRTSLENYVCYGVHPGGFLTALLSNDLMGTFMSEEVVWTLEEKHVEVWRTAEGKRVDVFILH
jgi:hypothetical protein